MHGQTRSSVSHSTSALADVRPVSITRQFSSLNYFTVYCNSLLATLNARKEMSDSMNEDGSLTFERRNAHRMTNHSVLTTSFKVGYLRYNTEHGLIIASVHAEQYCHQDRYHRRVHLGGGEQRVEGHAFCLTDGWPPVPFFK